MTPTSFALGLEYALLDWTPTLAFRAGTWFDPDHRIVDVSGDPFVDALAQPVGDQWHFTAGVGIVVRRFQVDAGFDIAAVVHDGVDLRRVSVSNNDEWR